ncbi:MAG: hypothetical protein RIS48_2371 [Pseudomonadota bacterium]|jgi:cation/acetate symporter
MKNPIYEKMRNNPKFHQLVQKRTRFAWTLSLITLAAFYGFVMLVAFQPGTIGLALSAGSQYTVGVVLELSMFIVFWLMTWAYVRRANGEFDALTQEIVREAVSGGQQ